MILGFGKKKPPRTTFKDQVTEFWKWFASVADRFLLTIDEGRCESLASEVSKVTDKTLPRMSWVFGPGKDGGHSFTVSGEGIVAKQLLAEYWCSRAPQIPQWLFHASRQPNSADHLEDFAIRVSEQHEVDVKNFLVRTSVDDESEVIHLVAWHPSLVHVPDDHHFQILFLVLDEALGEFGTQTWLGEIKIEPFEAGEGTRSIASLPTFIEQVQKYHGWQKLPPLDAYTMYETNTKRGQDRSAKLDFARSDTVVGSSCIPNIIFELLENEGKLAEDPLEGTGAEFVYVEVEGSVFPDGQQSEVRGKIEDAINDALHAEYSGRTLGGAFGYQNSYIDMILFDGDNSRRIVQETLDRLELRDFSHIKSFV